MAARTESTVDVVALVGSAGGLQAVSSVLRGLPDDFSAAVVVLLHLLPDHPSQLAAILRRRTGLTVKEAQDGDVLEPGCVYVAPPDAHLVVRRDHTLALDHSPPVRFLRPNVNMLLDSLAGACDDHCTAVVLTGTGMDGATGATAVKAAGGQVFAQDEATSEYFGMPSAAIAAGAVDRVLALDEIAPALVALVDSA
jgi:two-component system chemotaxis response regulator CheB